MNITNISRVLITWPRFQHLQSSKRYTLRSSNNSNIQALWSLTNKENVRADSLLIKDPYTVALHKLSEEQTGEATNHILSLKIQGLATKAVMESISPKNIKRWHQMTLTLPGFLFNFIRKALQSQLPTMANLNRWGRADTNLCPLCNNIQTNKHVFSNCSNAVSLKRYTERHNKILYLLACWIQEKMDRHSKLFVDLPGFNQTEDIFNNIRPDMVIIKNNIGCVIELTICHETNLTSSKKYKEEKYRDLNKLKSQQVKNIKFSLSTCEVSVLGLINFYVTSMAAFGIKDLDQNLSDTLAKKHSILLWYLRA